MEWEMEQKKRQEKIENERFMRGELPRSNQDNKNEGSENENEEEDENEYYVGDSDDDDEVFVISTFHPISIHSSFQHSSLFYFCFVAPFRVFNMR